MSSAINISQESGGMTGRIELNKDNGNTFTSGASKKSVEDESHQAISSYFIGPQAENLEFFKKNLDVILEQLRLSRVSYFPQDGEFITKSMQASKSFKKRTSDIAKAVETTTKMLGDHSIPFWSPRYQAHMCTDLSMPAVLGYFTTMLYNPNNVAFEASPFTTLIEMEVGKQLTRNLKFYPLSIRQALDESLSFAANTLRIKTAQDEEKLFTKLTTWELLNLKPETVLDIPDRLNNEYGISSKFLEHVIDKYGIQSRGKDALERDFGIEKPAQYMVSNTRHYSWPKGAAIAGIGSDNVIGIDVDHGARMDMKKLEERLEANLKHQQPVYAVVAIIGSTEEGAVDRLGEVLALRRRFQARGLSFLVHADAAWGGYFASMLPTEYAPGMGGVLPVGSHDAQWAAMTDDSMPFVVVPFNMLPSELAHDATPDSIEAEKRWIRDNILSASNLEIVANSTTSPGGDTALSLLRKLGSDLNINAFAINFRNRNGKLNTDTLQANELMKRIITHFSVDSPADNPTEIPLYLTSTEFEQKLYGNCAKNFRKRLGLSTEDGHDLFVLRNVVMSPFPTERDFIRELTHIFKTVVEEEVKAIFEITMPPETKALYRKLRLQYPETIFTFHSRVNLNEALAEHKGIQGYMQTNMPFYLYGSRTDSDIPEYHIEHALLRGPNIQLTASNIAVDVAFEFSETPLLLSFDSVRENVMQPFPEVNTVLASHPAFFFREGKQLDVSVWRDPVDRAETNGNKILEGWEKLDKEHLLGKGTVTLCKNLWVDAEALNRDPKKTLDNQEAWEQEFEKYLKDVGSRKD
ncbi:hypothetical protein N0V95_001834 [Ascochyta clinopodiicola]|nr:hypothetical protein N0V95_001834 [Ascochyta clinopodiicola]